MSIRSRVFDWRCRRATEILELRRTRRMASDLSSYVTARERADLTALLDALDDDQTIEVRELLDRRDGCAHPRRAMAAGLGYVECR